MRKLSMWIYIVVLLLLGLSVRPAGAQTIRYEVKVKGYSSAGWIEVRDGANVGGKVIRDRSGAWTDRAARGEDLRVSIGEPRCPYVEAHETIVGVVADNGFVRGARVSLPYQGTFRVRLDPGFDNVILVVLNPSNGHIVTRRVPIGSR